MWGWIAVAAVAFAGLSVAVALVIARILGTIGDEIAQLLEAEPWISAPLTREIERSAEVTQINFAAPAGDRRSRSSQG